MIYVWKGIYSVLYRTRKVFLKHHHLNTLIEHKQIKEKSVIIIQAVVRGYQQKCKYDKLLEDKRKQESLMQLLLEEIEMSGIGPFERLEALEKIDEKRLIGKCRYNGEIIIIVIVKRKDEEVSFCYSNRSLHHFLHHLICMSYLLPLSLTLYVYKVHVCMCEAFYMATLIG